MRDILFSDHGFIGQIKAKRSEDPIETPDHCLMIAV